MSVCARTMAAEAKEAGGGNVYVPAGGVPDAPCRRDEFIKQFKGFHLTYFDIWARAEPTRLLFCYAGVPFVDKRVTREELAMLCASGEPPFDKLPYLDVTRSDGSAGRFAQSGALVRFVAQLSDMMPEDPIEAAQADALYNAAEELSGIQPIVHVLRHKEDKTVFESRWKDWQGMAPPKLGCIDRVLGIKDGPFLLGHKASYADIMVFQIAMLAKELDADIMSRNGFDNVVACCEGVASLPRISDALKVRPGPGILPPKKK